MRRSDLTGQERRSSGEGVVLKLGKGPHVAQFRIGYLKMLTNRDFTAAETRRTMGGDAAQPSLC